MKRISDCKTNTVKNRKPNKTPTIHLSNNGYWIKAKRKLMKDLALIGSKSKIAFQ